MTVQTPLQLVITIGIIALGTFLIRALPFFLFPAGKETPRVVTYLGAVLPSALFVIVVHKWRHNLLLSIVGGTVLYMLLVQRLLSF